MDSLDIANLDSFAPKAKAKKQLEQSARIEIQQLTPEQIKKPKIKDEDTFYPTEFRSYGEIVLPVPDIPPIDNGETDTSLPPSNQIEKPIIDLFVLLKNCSEYIILNEQYQQSLIQYPDLPIIDRYSYIMETANHNYFRYIQEEMRKSLNLTKIEFETDTYIFRDYVWDNYILDFNTNEIMLINVFFNFIKDKKIDTTNFVILQTDKATMEKPVLNHLYCNKCAFKNICQRRALEEN